MGESGYEVGLSGTLTAVPDTIDDYTDILIVEIDEDASEFATRITLYRTPDEDAKARELYVAFHLAAQLNCRSIINWPFHFADHPYCSLIVDAKGRMFEADNDSTNWGDGEGGPVWIVREVHLPVHQFDGAGNLIS